MKYWHDLTQCILHIVFTGALVTNRVLCLVPLVAWFEDWMFVREFKVMPNYWYIPVEVVGECRQFPIVVIYAINSPGLSGKAYWIQH